MGQNSSSGNSDKNTSKKSSDKSTEKNVKNFLTMIGATPYEISSKRRQQFFSSFASSSNNPTVSQDRQRNTPKLGASALKTSRISGRASDFEPYSPSSSSRIVTNPSVGTYKKKETIFAPKKPSQSYEKPISLREYFPIYICIENL